VVSVDPDRVIERITLSGARVLEVRKQVDWIPGTQTPGHVYRVVIVDPRTKRARELGYAATTVAAPQFTQFFAVAGLQQLDDDYAVVAYVQGIECKVVFLSLVETPQVRLPREPAVIGKLHQPPDGYYLVWWATFTGSSRGPSLGSVWQFQNVGGRETLAGAGGDKC
jgi:hypothetical protein